MRIVDLLSFVFLFDLIYLILYFSFLGLMIRSVFVNAPMTTCGLTI